MQTITSTHPYSTDDAPETEAPTFTGTTINSDDHSLQPSRRLHINRNLGLLWLGESISLFGDQFYLVALPWLVLQLTGSALAVGTILATAGIPRALLMLVGGVFTDRMSPRAIMIFSNAARIVITGILAFLVMTQSTQVWMLYILSFAFGVVDAFFHPAYMAIMPMLVDEEDLGMGNALLQGSGLLVQGVGPGIAGVLINLSGIAISFIIDTASFILATGTLLGMNPRQIKSVDVKKSGILSEVREAITHITGDELLRPLMLIITALNFLFIGPMMVGPSALATQRFGEQGAVALGALLSAMGIGSVIGMAVGGVSKPKRLGIVTLSSFALAAIGIIGSGFSYSLSLTTALFALVGSSYGFSNLLVITWLQKRISKELMGRIMSIVMLSSTGLMPISSALAGIVAEHDLTLLFALNGTLLLALVGGALLNRPIRRMQA
ncbi:MAG: MFS transporter [Anaerolineaceae bacterium]|nr:MFS transporter [Anaerolineaceae bacterium]